MPPRLVPLLAGLALLGACGAGGARGVEPARGETIVRVTWPDGRPVAGVNLTAHDGSLCGRARPVQAVQRLTTDDAGCASVTPSPFGTLVSPVDAIGDVASGLVLPGAEAEAVDLVLTAARLRIHLSEVDETKALGVRCRMWRVADDVTSQELLGPGGEPRSHDAADTVAIDPATASTDLFVEPSTLCLLSVCGGPRDAPPGLRASWLAGEERWIRIGPAGSEQRVDLRASGGAAHGTLELDLQSPGGAGPVAGRACVESLGGLTVAEWQLARPAPPLPVGSWRLVVEPEPTPDTSAQALPYRRVVSIRDGSTTLVRDRLQAGGRVRLALSSTAGRLAHVEVIATSEDGARRTLRDAWVRAEDDASFAFAIGPVPLGEPLLAREVLPPGRWTLSLSHGRLAAEPVDVEIRPGAVLDVRFFLAPP